MKIFNNSRNEFATEKDVHNFLKQYGTINNVLNNKIINKSVAYSSQGSHSGQLAFPTYYTCLQCNKYTNENDLIFSLILLLLLKKVSYVHDHTLKNMYTKFHDDWLNSLRVKE